MTHGTERGDFNDRMEAIKFAIGEIEMDGRLRAALLDLVDAVDGHTHEVPQIEGPSLSTERPE